MSSVSANKGTFSVKAYRGDAKTLLAFNLDKASAKNLAGFTIQCQPDGQPAYYIQNSLQFATPSDHAQDPKEPPKSSINAPIHKFRWLHVPGTIHQGLKPFLGKYTYTLTPRYFDSKNSLQPLDPARSVSVTIDVNGFVKAGVEFGFARGWTQSQAFVHHFGLNALIRPDTKDLIFDTSQQSGSNAAGEKYTYSDEYEWLGFTARKKIFDMLNEVAATKSLHLDVFAYDLNEPDFVKILLQLAKEGRIRVILDNSKDHHDAASSMPEDQFEKLFKQAAAGKSEIKRGMFARYAHDKVLIVSNAGGAQKVLTGSTNFSVTGLYVNSNHVVIFNDPKVAEAYAGVFEEAWNDGVSIDFCKSQWSAQPLSFASSQTPQAEISFAPHTEPVAKAILQDLATRITQEGQKSGAKGSVLFAVMQIDSGVSPVYEQLNKLHQAQNIFSYGISDSPKGIYLYPVGASTGVLVTGKPQNTHLPPPFDQVPGIKGFGHQVHHKFVVCGFNGSNPVVYCGSSNLAVGGEKSNGDNLIAIHDGDIATVFAIEALALVDHFNFLDSTATPPAQGKEPKAAKGAKRPKSKAVVAATPGKGGAPGWFLSTNDNWAQKFFDPKDLHSVDRELFG